MFLKEFNKGEAIAFMNLVKLFSEVDKDVAREEKRLIKDYLKELDLKEDEITDLSYDELMKVLKVMTERQKKIVYFELVGLALVDGKYGDDEVDFLDKVAIDLDINRSKKIAFANYFYNFKEIHDFSVLETENLELESLKREAETLL